MEGQTGEMTGHVVFLLVIGKSDCMRGKRWRRGGKVFHVPFHKAH